MMVSSPDPDPKLLYQTGLASLYDFKGDRFSGQHVYACEASLRKKEGKDRWEKMLSMGVAHRRLPCGTLVCIRTLQEVKKNHLSCTPAYVIDRGPYGALTSRGEWVVRAKLLPGERYRGVMDLRPPIAQKIKFNGLEVIEIYRSIEKKTNASD